MTVYAILFLICAAALLLPALLIRQFRKAGFILSGALLVVALLLFGIDCAVSCVSVGDLYVPKR